jgi:hypothetical protein
MATQTLRYIPYDAPVNLTCPHHTKNNEAKTTKTTKTTETIKTPKSLAAFQRQAQRVHGDRYDYSQVTPRHLLKATSRIPVKCKFCRYTWNPTVYQHLIARWGCANCSGMSEWDLLKFIELGSTIQETASSHLNSPASSPTNSPASSPIRLVIRSIPSIEEND